ncbi:MAG: hypothetical protein ACK42E_03915, partial [Candidatus Bipolaricaulaceae bacterium]
DPHRNCISSLQVSVPPEGLACRVLLPMVEGAGLLGLPELLVPLPAGIQVEARREQGRWEIVAPPNLDLRGVRPTGALVPMEDVPGVKIRRRG